MSVTVTQISEVNFNSTLQAKTPLGYVVIFFYEDLTPIYEVLSPVYLEISRRCTFSQFYKANISEFSDDVLAKHGILSTPMFVIAQFGNIKYKFGASTKDTLIQKMKEKGVLKETEEFY